MAKRLAILQSNYIPWKGYFDLINSVDEFIFYDDMQYTKNDWRNRNKIKTSQGLQWLTIPVKHSNLAQTIRDTQVASDVWRVKHWKTIVQAYGKSPYFAELGTLLKPLYIGPSEMYLSTINRGFVEAINGFLGISTKLSWSSDFTLDGDRNQRLISLCAQAGADIYLTGPSALDYMDRAQFAKAGISVEVASYSNYPEYEQLYPSFEHAVSIIDLMFTTGRSARRFMKSFPETISPVPFTVPLQDWIQGSMGR